jgi:hypothetical protein
VDTRHQEPQNDPTIESAEPASESSLDELAGSKQPGLIREFWDFLRYNKKWWLLPILVTLALLGLFIVLTGTPLAPFIYTLF